jgi:hypothetical protein
MRELLILAVHPLVTCAKLLRSGGARAVAAESLLLKHRLLISNRSRQRAPNLTTLDRFVLVLTALFVNPQDCELGALVKPATLFKFHQALVDGKYRLLFSRPSSSCTKWGAIAAKRPRVGRSFSATTIKSKPSRRVKQQVANDLHTR